MAELQRVEFLLWVRLLDFPQRAFLRLGIVVICMCCLVQRTFKIVLFHQIHCFPPWDIDPSATRTIGERERRCIDRAASFL